MKKVKTFLKSTSSAKKQGESRSLWFGICTKRDSSLNSTAFFTLYPTYSQDTSWIFINLQVVFNLEKYFCLRITNQVCSGIKFQYFAIQMLWTFLHNSTQFHTILYTMSSNVLDSPIFTT